MLKCKNNLSFSFLKKNFHVTHNQVKWANHFVLNFYWLRWEQSCRVFECTPGVSALLPGTHPTSRKQKGNLDQLLTSCLGLFMGGGPFNEVKVPTEGSPQGLPEVGDLGAQDSMCLANVPQVPSGAPHTPWEVFPDHTPPSCPRGNCWNMKPQRKGTLFITIFPMPRTALSKRNIICVTCVI